MFRELISRRLDANQRRRSARKSKGAQRFRRQTFYNRFRWVNFERLEDRIVMDATNNYWAGNPEALVSIDGTPHEEEHLPVLLQQYDLFNPDGYLTGPSAGQPVEIALDYLRSRAADLGVTPYDFNHVDVWTNYVTETTGITHLSIRQMLNGLEIDNANFNVNVAADGRILNVGGGFVADVDRFAADYVIPEMDALTAVTMAAQSLGVIPASAPQFVQSPDGPSQSSIVSASGVSLEDIPAGLEYVATPDGLVHLTWSLMIQTTGGEHWFDLHVGSNDGAVVSTHDFAHSEATYNVYALPTESPNHGGRTTVTDPNIITPLPAVVPSPFGWHDTNGAIGAEFTITRGNNVSAYTDTDNNNVIDAGSQPNGGVGLNFNFPIDLTQQPSTYRPASVTNLFYWNNIIHDVTYLYGFNEAARNFQVNNYGRGGLQNDAVNAEAQDGGGFTNANFLTPPDGNAPRMQMYLGNNVTPMRDGALDNGIVIHEYGHGISNRLTGNGSGLGATQSGGMGEGWSDWFGLMFTQTSAAETTAAHGVGTYLLGQAASGLGFRNYRYDFDIANVTLESFLHYGTGTGQSTAVHNTGTRWASALWDLNHLLIQKYGYDSNLYNSTSSAGNIEALHLVMNGLKMQSLNPTFFQARDAILAADTALNAGANHCEIWTAFARRGLGQGGSTVSSNSSVITTSFTRPLGICGLEVGATVPAVVPAPGSTVATVPVNYVVNFSHPVLASSVNATDFAVDGVFANTVSLGVGNTSATFSFSAPPFAAEGLHTMSMAAASVVRASDSNPLLPFSGQFRYDAVPLTVTTTVPTAGGVFNTLPQPIVYDIHFNEPVLQSSVQSTDLIISGITGASRTFVPPLLNSGTTARFSITGILSITQGTLNVTLPAGAITDTFGNPNASPFTASYQMDVVSAAYPTPLTPKDPLGSLIYDPILNGVINFAGDLDTFTLSIDSAQDVTVLVTPTSPGLQPSVTLRSPAAGNPIIGAAIASAPGQKALLQSISTSTLGTYLIEIRGDSSTIGNYTVQVILNAALESEGNIAGATNDTQTLAQDINASFLTVQTPQATAQRGAVLGSLRETGNLVANGSFETGTFSGWTTATTGTPFVPWTNSPAGAGGGFGLFTTTPQDGTRVAWNGFDGTGPMQYTMTQDIALPAASQLTLSWKDRLQWNFTVATGLAQARSYFVELLNPSNNALLTTLYSFSTGPEISNPTGNTGWLSHAVDVSAFAGSTVRLRFREVIPQSGTGPGQAEFDAIPSVLRRVTIGITSRLPRVKQ